MGWRYNLINEVRRSRIIKLKFNRSLGTRLRDKFDFYVTHTLNRFRSISKFFWWFQKSSSSRKFKKRSIFQFFHIPWINILEVHSQQPWEMKIFCMKHGAVANSLFYHQKIISSTLFLHFIQNNFFFCSLDERNHLPCY